MFKVPAFMFETNTAFIDDDKLYIKFLTLNSGENHYINGFNNCDTFIKQANKDFLFIDDNNHSPTDVDNLILKSLYEKKTCIDGMVSVIISDLHMEDINGLEFFHKIKSPFVYKILISNFIDSTYEQEIAYAQNTGVIDAVFDKENIKKHLSSIISFGKYKFFSRLSSKVYWNEHKALLTDTIFADFFQKITDNFKPDFIWPNQFLNMFKLNKVNSKTNLTMFVSSLDENKSLADTCNAEAAPPEILQKLKNGDFMLCCENPALIDGVEWPLYLKPAKKLQSSDTTFLYNIETEMAYE